MKAAVNDDGTPASPYFRGGSKPYTRWWWLDGPFRPEDVTYQLEWLRDNGFGGVELAWLEPTWAIDMGRRPAWLGPEWASLLAFTKQEADRLGLGCDFTFGSCWPFGGSVVRREDASRTFDGLSPQRLEGTWEDARHGPQWVLNHLDRGALRRYAEAMAPAFSGGLRGSPSALFCDSLELDTRRLWDPKLWDEFADRFGYRLEEALDADGFLEDAAVRYDYRRVLADAILREFYQEFAAICRELGAYSRVQCHGAPTDLLSAYAAVDVPESESLLFDPPFSRIAASAAALAGKAVVSAETFTCIYGFVSHRNLGPLRYQKREQTADLKLLADALFAQGVNQIVWHGMPFNGPDGRNEFYASVHVGPDSGFAGELPALNGYLERVSGLLRRGRAESRLAVYLPNEDNRMLGLIPDEERTPGAVHRWEMRHVAVPREVEGFAPLWISGPFLARAGVADGRLLIGDCAFSGLLVDVDWLEADALAEILRLARTGLPIILPRAPQAPGRRPASDFRPMLDDLRRLPNVFANLVDSGLTPLVAGHDLPPFWARRSSGGLDLFFAHPEAREVKYPMGYGQSGRQESTTRRIAVDFDGRSWDVELEFPPCQSRFVRISRDEGVRLLDVEYHPRRPARAE